LSPSPRRGAATGGSLNRGFIMNDEQLDEVSKKFATGIPRRRAVKLLAATAAGGVVSLVGARSGLGADPGRCRRAGSTCRRSSECCSGICSAQGRCICPPPKVADARGHCVCPPNTTTCGTAEFAPCCPSGTDCCLEGTLRGFCCPPGTHCSTCTAPGFSFETCCPDGTNCQCDQFGRCQCR
jgi:hypothetical protein